jgi:hypothetical protein
MKYLMPLLLIVSLFSCDEIVNTTSQTKIDTVTVINGERVINIQTDYGVTGQFSNDCDDTQQFQAAIDAATVSGMPIYLPNGTYCVSTVYLASNVKFIGESNTHTIIKSLPAIGTNNPSTFYKPFSWGSVENIAFENLKFDGDRSNASHSSQNVIGILLVNTETIKHLRVNNCIFTNVKNDAIKIVGNPGGSAISTDIRVSNSSFLGNAGDSTTNHFMDAVRLEMYDDDMFDYGRKIFENIVVENCYAEYIRTLADLKRGCSNFLVTSCITKDMHDCHHSVDGSFNGIITDCVGSMTPSFVSQTGTNFIEVQGEDVTIADVVFNGNFVTKNGIVVTDYGTDEEWKQDTLGHISKNIIVDNCNLKNLQFQGIKFINVQYSKISNCSVHNTGYQPYVVDSGTSGRQGPDDVLLTSRNVYLNNNLFTNSGMGISLLGHNHVLGEGNINEYGSTPLEQGSTSLIANTETSFSVTSHGVEYNQNPNLFINPVTTRINFFNTGKEDRVFDTSDAPLNGVGSVLLEDDLTNSLSAVQMDNKIAATYGKAIHFSICARHLSENTGVSFSIVVQEFNGSTFISYTFYGTTSLATTWKKFVGNHKVKDQDTNNLIIQIVPATHINDNQVMGAVKVAAFKISDRPISL